MIDFYTMFFLLLLATIGIMFAVIAPLMYLINHVGREWFNFEPFRFLPPWKEFYGFTQRQ